VKRAFFSESAAQTLRQTRSRKQIAAIDRVCFSASQIVSAIAIVQTVTNKSRNRFAGYKQIAAIDRVWFFASPIISAISIAQSAAQTRRKPRND
jgi:hypothetical protein